MFVNISHSPIANLTMHVFGMGGTQITYTSTSSTLKKFHTDKLSKRTDSKVNITINTLFPCLQMSVNILIFGVY